MRGASSQRVWSRSRVKFKCLSAKYFHLTLLKSFFQHKIKRTKRWFHHLRPQPGCCYFALLLQTDECFHGENPLLTSPPQLWTHCLRRARRQHWSTMHVLHADLQPPPSFLTGQRDAANIPKLLQSTRRCKGFKSSLLHLLLVTFTWNH